MQEDNAAMTGAKNDTPKSARLRVALVDDHDLFRQGLASLLQHAGFDVAWEASCTRDAQELVAKNPTDVLIMDVSMPGTSGIEATRAIVKTIPSTRILILTQHEGEEFVVQAFLAGATGYAVKTQSIEQIVEAVQTTAAGRLYLAPSIPRRTLDEYNRRIRHVSKGILDELSPRERQVFELVVQNKSNRAISEELRIAVKTVETHRLSLNKKLGVHSAAELIRLAATHGLLHR